MYICISISISISKVIYIYRERGPGLGTLGECLQPSHIRQTYPQMCMYVYTCDINVVYDLHTHIHTTSWNSIAGRLPQQDSAVCPFKCTHTPLLGRFEVTPIYRVRINPNPYIMKYIKSMHTASSNSIAGRLLQQGSDTCPFAEAGAVGWPIPSTSLQAISGPSTLVTPWCQLTPSARRETGHTRLNKCINRETGHTQLYACIYAYIYSCIETWKLEPAGVL